MLAENFPNMFAKLLLGAHAAVIDSSRILECPGKQKKVATLKSGASDVPSKDATKTRDDPVEATAVDQAESRFQMQIPIAKVCDFKNGCVGPGGESTAVINGRGAVVEPQNGKALVSQPPANPTVSAAHVDDALIFRKPAGIDRFNEFLLRLIGFPVRAKFGLEPLTIPSMPVSLVHPIGKQLFYATFQSTGELPPVFHCH